MLKIVAISDLHGNLPIIDKPAEIMLIAGDVIPFNIQFNKHESKKWLEGPFAEWIKQLPVKEVFMVAGNHDAYFESISATNLGLFRQATNFKLNYLKNSTLVYHSEDGKAIKIFGTPYCHQFGDWAFMDEDDKLREYFAECPDEVDIILSHDAPYGITDVCLERLAQL